MCALSVGLPGRENANSTRLLVSPAVQYLRDELGSVVDLNALRCIASPAHAGEHFDHVVAADALIDPDRQHSRLYASISVKARSLRRSYNWSLTKSMLQHSLIAGAAGSDLALHGRAMAARPPLGSATSLPADTVDKPACD